MAWDKGWNHRQTSGYVTDGANETYVLEADAYPVTRNSSTFGYLDAVTANRDRVTTVDRRLAGVTLRTSPDQCRFQVDLPNTGDYIVDLGFCDQDVGAGDVYAEIRDNTSTLATINPGGGVNNTQVCDASGVKRTNSADWVSNKVTVQHTFATTTFILRFGRSTGTERTPLAHVFLSEAAGGGGPTRGTPFGHRGTAFNGGRTFHGIIQ